MSKYEKYKPSGIDWIGEIPTNWKLRRFKNDFSFVKGKNPKDTFYADESNGRKIDMPYLSMEYLRSSNPEAEFPEFDERLVPVEEEETLLLWDGSNAGEFMKSKKGYLSSTMVKIDHSKKINSKYSFYIFQCFERILRDFTNGMGIPHVNGVLLNNTFLPLTTDQSEQHTIAKYLDDQTQKIDRLIANKKAQAEKLKELRQIEINNAVTKGLNPNAEMKGSGIGWLGEIPKHWETRKISTNFEIIGSGTTPEAGKDDYYDDGKYYFVNTGDLKDCEIFGCDKKITEEAFNKFTSLKLFPVNTLLIAMYGATIGKVGILKTEATTNQACCALANSYRFDINYMFYFFIGIREDIIRLSYGGGQPNISQDTIKQLRIPCPPKKEQLDIVKYLQQRTTALDNLLKNIDVQIEKLQELRKIKIYEAVTGKIKVNAYVEATA